LFALLVGFASILSLDAATSLAVFRLLGTPHA